MSGKTSRHGVPLAGVMPLILSACQSGGSNKAEDGGATDQPAVDVATSNHLALTSPNSPLTVPVEYGVTGNTPLEYSSVSLLTAPSAGTVQLNANGSYIYIPDQASRPDIHHFTYVANQNGAQVEGVATVLVGEEIGVWDVIPNGDQNPNRTYFDVEVSDHGVDPADLQTEVVEKLMLESAFNFYPGDIGSTQTLTFTYSLVDYRPPSTDIDDKTFSTATGYGIRSFTPAEAAAIRAALDEYESYINVTFTEVDPAQQGDFHLWYFFVDTYQGTNDFNGIGNYDYKNSQGTFDAFVGFNNDNDISSAEYFDLILHETGHALTLRHAGPYSTFSSTTPTLGDPVFQDYIPIGQDDNVFTVMSYSSNRESTTQSNETHLQLYDIATLQARWGAREDVALGDDIYSKAADGKLYVIWDGGGTDTIAATEAVESVIDLREGHFSTFGGYEKQLAVAYGVEIENATGAGGDDILHGNHLANILTGGAGDDILVGYAGDDIFNGGEGEDAAVFADALHMTELALGTNYIEVISSEGTDRVYEDVEVFVFDGLMVDYTVLTSVLNDMAV